MTDFQYSGGEYLDVGQQWNIVIDVCGDYSNSMRVCISELSPYRETIKVSIFMGENSDGTPTYWYKPLDLSWHIFKEKYDRGMAYPYIELEPIKHLPPHKFI